MYNLNIFRQCVESDIRETISNIFKLMSDGNPTAYIEAIQSIAEEEIRGENEVQADMRG